ncbi:MAG: ChbG/HpnK family deacetylase [Sedimentisphaerales bacterium]|nr:ChbG/HpnK family deacetylase [Sedimentisphaerales bacterium]
MAKKLIINADDFGLSKEVNKAVETAHKKGVITSATIMTNMPAAEEAVKIAKKNPNLGVGVHLNPFKGKPISKDPEIKPLLDSQGNFCFGHKALSLLCVFSHPVRQALKAELDAQIKWLIDRGIEPTHLDSHKHIHCCPAVYSIVCALANKYKIPAIRYCFEPVEVGATPWPLSTAQGRRNAKTLRPLARVNRLQDKGLIKTECIYGIAHMGKIDVSFFNAVSLYNDAEVAEVLTHPAISDDPGTKDIMSKPKRKTEFETLCDPKVKEYFREAGIELVHYGQL